MKGAPGVGRAFYCVAAGAVGCFFTEERDYFAVTVSSGRLPAKERVTVELPL